MTTPKPEPKLNQPWKVEDYEGPDYGGGGIFGEVQVSTADGKTNVCLMFHDFGAEAAMANIIAEAGTVYHETGLTPRELADQNKELLAALQGEHKACDWLMARLITLDKNFLPTKSPIWDLIVAGNSALTKSKGSPNV